MRAGIPWRLATVFLMVQPEVASAADLFFCEERDSVGFHLEAAQPERVRFPGARFTLFVEYPGMAVTIEGGPSFNFRCGGDDQVWTCSDGLRLFVLQRASGQFAMGRLAGLVLAGTPAQGLTREPLAVSWGVCER
ncbi:MAG: hypothetical protein FJX64_05440 [Alphaproteobacteria bacterium]|nr:hypothetical protein [Alphaproteobacteria bacterium]